jgi:hypothetical protein
MIRYSEKGGDGNVHSIEVLMLFDLGDRRARGGVLREHFGDQVLGGVVQAFLVLEQNGIVSIACAELCVRVGVGPEWQLWKDK